ncbi:MAG TPA: PsiF family protein [Usitatibacter sp.]|nr:PsiF family protein [Usitatibacter sp.]
MKSKFLWLVGCAVVWSLSVTAALAESDKRAGDKSAACTREARDLKGEEHHRFVVDCLKRDGNGNGDGHHSQQNKMKHCNVEAGRKELRGDERRAFMSSCLKG